MIYRKRDSDFELAVHFPNLPKGIHLPFSLYFYTKQGEPEVVAGFDGTNYTRCIPTDYGVDVQFEKNSFLSCAEIECRMEFPMSNPAYPKGREDFVEVRSTGVELYSTTPPTRIDDDNNEKPTFKPLYPALFQTNNYTKTKEWEVPGETWADLSGAPKQVYCCTFLGTLKGYQESVELTKGIISAVLVTGYVQRSPYCVLPGNVSMWDGMVTAQSLFKCAMAYTTTT